MQNDIVKPPTKTDAPEASAPVAPQDPKPAPTPAPAQDIVPQPPAKQEPTKSDNGNVESQQSKQAEDQTKATPPKPSGTPGPGLAIFWAVLLCSGLIGLAVYIQVSK